MIPVLTTQELIANLKQSSKQDYTSILETFVNDKTLFEAFESWSIDKYTRNCIYRDEQFELILLCWEEGQQTSIHNHGGEECWLCVMEGEIEEESFVQENDGSLIKINTEILKSDKVSYINDKIGLHRLKNATFGRSLSLHLYAKPIDSCEFYDEVKAKFVSKQLTYDTEVN